MEEIVFQKEIMSKTSAKIHIQNGQSLGFGSYVTIDLTLRDKLTGISIEEKCQIWIDNHVRELKERKKRKAQMEKTTQKYLI